MNTSSRIVLGCLLWAASMLPRGAHAADSASSPDRGPKDAPVTIVAIIDFQCPFSARASGTLEAVFRAYADDVRVIIKHNPLSFHQRARPAAIAAMAAHRQGQFWGFYGRAFAEQRSLGDRNLLAIARAIDLDLDQFRRDVADPVIAAQVDNEQRSALMLGQGGTPAFFINGRALSGAQPFEEFQRVIDEERTAARGLTANGVPRAEVHSTRARANLGDQFPVYWDSLLGGAIAKKPKTIVSEDVWKVPVSGAEPTRGRSDALVTIVLFSGFQCPFCKKLAPNLDQVLRQFPDDVRLVWKHSPLFFHDRAMPAARAGWAAHQAGKFWEFHDLVYADQRKLGDKDLERHAKKLGLDRKAFKANSRSPASLAAVEADLQVAASVNARGTPHCFINGRSLRGAVPIEDLVALVEEELEKARRAVEQGTPAESLYASIVETGKLHEPLNPKVHPFDATGRAILGNPNGDIEVVWYIDYQCPFSARAASEVAGLLASSAHRSRVRVVVKHFPLSFHNEARDAALVALAAGKQGKYWQMHDHLFTNRRVLAADMYVRWAEALGLDIPTFVADMADPELSELIEADMEEARKSGLRGTPTFFINGRLYEGTGTFSVDAFDQVVRRYFSE